MYPPIGWQVVAGGSSLSGENWAQNRWQIKNIFGFVIDASRLMQHSQTTLQAVVKLWKVQSKNILPFWFACKPFFLNKFCLETASNHQQPSANLRLKDITDPSPGLWNWDLTKTQNNWRPCTWANRCSFLSFPFFHESKLIRNVCLFVCFLAGYKKKLWSSFASMYYRLSKFIPRHSKELGKYVGKYIPHCE